MRGTWIQEAVGRPTIVFVHGILSDGVTCWTNANGTYWPGLVAETLADHGAYVFTYKTGYFSRAYGIGDAVEALEVHLGLDGLLDGRPLIFVAHSMGGLVVRKLLVRLTADATNVNGRFGLFLVGSPTLGASLANWLAPFAFLLNHAQAIALRFGEGNRWLVDLDHDFVRLKESGRFHLIGRELVEDVPPRYLFAPVVPSFSAAKYFDRSYKVPDTDHMSIAKPGDADAIQHRLLVAFVQEAQRHWLINEPWIAGASSTVSEPILRKRAPNGMQEQTGRPFDPLVPCEHRSNTTFVRRGRMRTAYPTDLSFAQLYDQDFYIEPRVSAFRDGSALTDVSGAERAVTDVIEKLIAQRSVLILGEPGAGKSFLTYLIQRRLMEQDVDATCLNFIDLLDIVATSGLPSEDQEIIILDGLDEGQVEGARLDAAMSLSTDLSGRGRVLCVCRRENYELALCRILPPKCFDEILFVLPWRPDIEFKKFIEKLAEKGYTRAPEILSAVRDVPELQSLVTRPLHARMLSYLWQDDELSSPLLAPNLAFVYEAYMRKFARSVTGASSEAWTEQDVLAQWRSLAWREFRGKPAHRGRIEASTLAELINDRQTLQRAVLGILNRVESARGEHYEFLHHSFYEFLVSWEFLERLRAACNTGNAADAVDLFRLDMTREIRHYAVAQLNGDGFASSCDITDFLSQVYDLARGETGTERSLLETCNLIVYFLSRYVTSKASPRLRRLLSNESLPFLRTSLYWGAAAVDNIDCTRAYVDELLENKEMRALNRGYHLYYYGDLDSHTAPPYEDNDSAANWSRTRRALGERTKSLQSGPIAKCYLDIVTFLDLAHFHATGLKEIEIKSIEQALARMEDVWGEQVTRVSQAFARNSSGALGT
ncbi:MAG: alpha/beta fold hydrolase [Sulfuritalea sp.]|nr:alpha/beta fold hydrolase [Sulfuritalea sp.]